VSAVVNVAVAACLVLVADCRKSGFKFECMCACAYVDEMKCVSKGPCLEFVLNFLIVFVIDFFSIKFLRRFGSIGEKVAHKRSKKGEFLQS
jgi:large-conductance mechanosensitive channel